MIGELPRSLVVNGVTYDIRTDFRDILRIIAAFDDPELESSEKVYVCLYILFQDFDDIPKDDYEAAFTAALNFIDNDAESGEKPKRSPRTMDWEQDERLIFPAVNKVAGFETRTAEYIHWWTFLGYFMEITDGVYSTIMSLRLKKAKGKKLEKWEQEFWGANKDVCTLKRRVSAEEQAEIDRINAMLG